MRTFYAKPEKFSNPGKDYSELTLANLLNKDFSCLSAADFEVIFGCYGNAMAGNYEETMYYVQQIVFSDYCLDRYNMYGFVSFLDLNIENLNLNGNGDLWMKTFEVFSGVFKNENLNWTTLSDGNDYVEFGVSAAGFFEASFESKNYNKISADILNALLNSPSETERFWSLNIVSQIKDFSESFTSLIGDVDDFMFSFLSIERESAELKKMKEYLIRWYQ